MDGIYTEREVCNEWCTERVVMTQRHELREEGRYQRWCQGSHLETDEG